MPSPPRPETAAQVEQVWADMMAAARALDANGIQAAYAPHPTVAINGVILDDFHAHFATVRQWLASLRTMDARYENVHVEVLSPDAVVTTMNHHLRWQEASGNHGEWHSAWTAVFRRGEAGWRIVYSHESTPPAQAQ